jgi:hypothetical protein
VHNAGGHWEEVESIEGPNSGIWKTGDCSCLAASATGLFFSEDGADWHQVSDEGNCTQVTFAGSDGWAGISSERNLLRTYDGGRTWQASPSPFGNLRLIALQAFPGVDADRFGYLMAATYDQNRQAVKLWRSDDGERWSPGADSFTPWPLVATLGDPAVFSVGSMISIRQPNGTWVQGTVGDAPFRRIISDGSALYALELAAIWRSDDLGSSWSRDDDGLPSNEIFDIAIFDGRLHVLLTGGRLLRRLST